ncbi:hypothetical protein [Legionella brunensis]|uniref:Coiled-coil protein n=1 Tax=Legionella brunensis TaxID=29422 RepID=A0A0W0S482_9GAMM|nr:hypothetical protein [Legionella brunensis]KTC78154.1 hypothetical protein Lbru_2446 [Legionella brunensis]
MQAHILAIIDETFCPFVIKFPPKAEFFATPEEIENQILHIDNLIKREKFEEAKQKCTKAIDQIKRDISRIRDEVIAKAELERSIRVKLKYTAEILVSML